MKNKNGPGLDRGGKLMVFNVLKGTCNYNNYRSTLDQHGIWWFSGGSFFHFERGEDDEEDVMATVVLWLSEGFWICVERRAIGIIMVEGWDAMVERREIDDNMMETNDKVVKGKGLTKIGEGIWDFNIRLEDWPASKGLSSEVMMAELCKGLKWV